MSKQTKIKIGGLDWTIYYNLEIFNKQNCFGLMDYNTHKIYIYSKLDPNNKKVYEFHELLHACIATGGLGDTFKSPQMEEVFVHTVSNLMCQVIEFKIKQEGKNGKI